MRIFIERFILGVLAPLVVLISVVNPLGFSWPQRIIGIVVIFVAASIAAYFAGWDEWRWERLRGLWWLWSIFGLSGGIALALWLIPLITGPQPEGDNAKQVKPLRSELNATKKELESAKRALETAKQTKASPPPVMVYLQGIGNIEAQYVRNMGPLNTVNRFSLAKEIGIKLGQDAAVVITAPRENMQIKFALEMLLNVGGHIKIVQPPNYDVNIDAPRLTESGYSGIIVHGHNDAQELMDNFLGTCFITRHSTKSN
jgi:hypothetical protein